MIVDLACTIMRNHGGVCTRLIEYSRKHPSPLLCSVEKEEGYVYSGELMVILLTSSVSLCTAWLSF